MIRRFEIGDCVKVVRADPAYGDALGKQTQKLVGLVGVVESTQAHNGAPYLVSLNDANSEEVPWLIRSGAKGIVYLLGAKEIELIDCEVVE